MKKRYSTPVLGLLVAAMVCGCTAKPAEPTPETTPEATGPKVETYTATAKGFGGDVEVTLTLTDDVLTDVNAVGEKETDGVGSKAIDELPGRMLAANSVEVDAIGGATVTSNAILTAAADALAQSGVTLVAKETGDTVEVEDARCDVVVVGGGIAGMTAAIEVADAGKSVILLEKADILGGAATISHSAVWAIGSELTSEHPFTADEVYEFFNKQAGPVYSKEVFYALANESYNSLHFLMDNGVVFNDITECNPQADSRFWCAMSGGFGVGMMEKLTEAYNTRSIDTRLRNKAVELTTDDTGAVTGVVVETGGKQYKIEAQKVILATGGIGQNPELMAQYEPTYSKIVANSTVAGATGDGHLMGVEVGGFMVGTGSMGVGTSLGKMDPVTFGQGLLVNIEGKKIGPVNEHYTKLYEVNNRQSDGKSYSIYPSDIAEYSKGGTQEVMEEYYEAGELYKADTIEELAEIVGFDAETLAATVAENNRQYEAGESDAFNSPVEEMLPIANGPFYCMTHISGMIGSVTGLGVDKQMHVITEDGDVIGNLYATGEMIYGNWFEGNYPMSGTGLGGCVSSGRIAAADALRTLK